MSFENESYQNYSHFKLLKEQTGIMRIIFLFVLFLSIQINAHAAKLEIAPVKMYLTQQMNIGAFTLKNQDDTPILIQLTVFKWTQKNGKDIYEKTQDFLANPPVCSIKPGQSQIIRVGLKNEREENQEELAYRIFFTQVLDETKSNQKTAQVNTKMQLSIPVFFAPKSVSKKLFWKIKKNHKKEKEFELTLSNAGNIHTQITKIEIYSTKSKKSLFSQGTFAYVLPRQSNSWMVSLPENSIEDQLKVVAMTDSGEVVDYAAKQGN